MNNNKRRQRELRKSDEAITLPVVTTGSPTPFFQEDEFSVFSEDEMSLLEEGKIAPTDGIIKTLIFAEENVEDKTAEANEICLSSIASYNTMADELKVRKENDEYISEKTIHVRRQDERKLMDNNKRVLTNMKITIDNLVDGVKDLFEKDDHENNYNENSAKRVSSKGSCGSVQYSPKQYHIEKRQIVRGTLLDRALSCIGIIRSEYGYQDTLDSKLQTYLQWTFHASFVTLFLSTFFIFVILVVFFSGFIALAGYLKPTCITPGTTSFHDTVTLSWTTFTTVGYGNIYPSLSSEDQEAGNCMFITFVTCFEAFIGVIYAGFCGAVIFGKVLRIQSQAQVTFSDILVIQFGETHRPRFETDASANGTIPCPTLQFRIVNKLYNKAGCEFIDATLNCVVINTDTDFGMGRKSIFSGIHEDKDEVNYSFAKLDIDISHHPFFKRVWTARHVLNQNSPILQPWARRLVRKNGGYWPRELNSYEGIKQTIKFDQLVVNFSGTSNISAASVYAQKIYESFDMSIGYQFVNLVYKSKSTKGMMIDMDMINDITEQEGGGGEPMDDRAIART